MKIKTVKNKSAEFMSQCQVLSFPWTTRRGRLKEEGEYTGILRFEPPVFKPMRNEASFPVIQMMNGTEPIVWGEGGAGSGASSGANSGVKGGAGIGAKSGAGNGEKTKIPRPKNAFILYRSHVSQMLKGAMAFKVRESNISSLVSEMWKKESEVVHAYYAKKAALEWVQHMKRLQQGRCEQSWEETVRRKSPSPTSDGMDGIDGSNWTDGATTVSSPVQTPLEDSFFAFGSPKTMEPAIDGVSQMSRMSLSPRSPDKNFLGTECMLGINSALDSFPGYATINKTSQETPFSNIIPPSLCSFKDPDRMGMNAIDLDYGYTVPQFPMFSTHPYIAGNDGGLDLGLRWPKWVSAPTAWPIQTI